VARDRRLGKGRAVEITRSTGRARAKSARQRCVLIAAGFTNQ
jgi:hypothetical protein